MENKIKTLILKALFYYSFIISLIMVIGGFYNTKSQQETMLNLVFLPVAIFFFVIWKQIRSMPNK